jgi:hypothetical protein
MKIVKEELGFERTGDVKKGLDVGKYSTLNIEKKLKSYENKGMKVNLDWDKTGENRKKVFKNFKRIEWVIEKLMELGVKPKDIRISHPTNVDVNSYTVLDGNNVLFYCLTERDAEIGIDFMESIPIPRWNTFRYSISRTFENIEITGRTEYDASSDWKPYFKEPISIEWLEELPKNRKIYSK